MKLLFDTHAFLWWITDDPQLSTKARELISDSHNTMYWSAASSWEVSIKYALGRLPLPETPVTPIICPRGMSTVTFFKLFPVQPESVIFLPLPFRRFLGIAISFITVI